MTIDSTSSTSPDADLPSGAFGEAVRAAASGSPTVSALETEQAWHRLRERIDREMPVVVGSISSATSTSRRRTEWWRFAAAALLAFGAAGAWRRLAPTRDAVSAPLGQRVAVTLPDGSSITLAAGSSASWIRGFRGAQREVTLDGEAYFEVVHDGMKPFLVRSRDGIAQDVGTRFIVRAWPELPQVEVLVQEGVVAFTDSTSARTTAVERRVQLHAGQRGQLDRDGLVTVMTADSAAFSWLTGTLAFADMPAHEALAVIGRWYGVAITVHPALAQRRLTARFVSQPLPQLLDALALALGASVERRGTQITLTP
ncbi:FecR family protein [Gemmatimonas groenlandica]|uniref:DUF4974 domain-containing protein n=1 Tax=Gemmatimonas groenlandica TaxID=2732249 RepID=A0A6M4IPL1_9BACT|nr:FecR domain-containing protein [Gemmatimonas groenlandica]QJR35689.1 DUF4974 domain-containing protein [Gemmatimonas groenlandica]